MEEFNKTAVKRIIRDMNSKLGVDADVNDYNHDQLVDIYNEIASSEYNFVKEKYNTYFHETLTVSN